MQSVNFLALWDVTLSRSATFPNVSKESILLSEGQVGQQILFLLLLTADNNGIRYFVNPIYVHLTVMSLFQHYRVLTTVCGSLTLSFFLICSPS